MATSSTNILSQEVRSLGQRFDNTTVNDHALLIQGDNYGTVVHSPCHASAIPHDRYGILFESLAFNGMGARLRNVAVALSNTCKWLFEHEYFLLWARTNSSQDLSSFLWLRGKPGSGKSTIMRETLTWAEREWTSRIILSYFFNARSPYILEKSILGLYRTLSHQLLCAIPRSRGLFEKTFAPKAREGGIREVEDWTETELENFWSALIDTIQLPPLTIFIDALDEGKDEEVRRMLSFLAHLTQRAASRNHQISVCLSSRHYPHVSIERCLSVTVEDQSGQKSDIELYLKNKLLGTSPNQMRIIRDKIRDRSAGVFLWVVLVIPMLNKAHDDGKNVQKMLRILKDIPPDLHKIFDRIASLNKDDNDEFVMLLRWVLFAVRPLRAIELYHVLQHSYRAANNIDKVDEDDEVDENTMKRYVLNTSRGLIEIREQHYSTDSTVQFIHETVRDYLLCHDIPKQRQLKTAASPDIILPSFQASQCHMKIAEECLHHFISVFTQITLAFVNAPDVFERFERHKHQKRQKRQERQERLKHLTRQTRFKLDELDGLDERDERDENYKRYKRYEHSYHYSARFWWLHWKLSGSRCGPKLLTFASELFANSTMLKTWLRSEDYDGSRFSQQIILADYGYDYRLEYAAQMEILELVDQLLSSGMDVNAQGGHYGNALQAASHKGNEEIVQMLLVRGADVNSIGGTYGTALEAASANGHVHVVQILFAHGADVITSRLHSGMIDRVGALKILLQNSTENIKFRNYYHDALEAAIDKGDMKNGQDLMDAFRAAFGKDPEIDQPKLTILECKDHRIRAILSDRYGEDAIQHLQNLGLHNFEQFSPSLVRYFRKRWIYIHIPKSACRRNIEEEPKVG